MNQGYWLTALIFLPTLGAGLMLLLTGAQPRTPATDGAEQAASSRGVLGRRLAIAVALAEFLLSLAVWWWFRPGVAYYQFQERYGWMPGYSVWYHIGIDGVSLLLILLTTFLTLLCVVYSARIADRSRDYLAFLLVLETAMVGVFCALDLVLFYVFWEMVLIPMYFLIGIWGHERRVYAAVKFFLYTFSASVLMLVAIVYLYAHTGSFSLMELAMPGSAPHAKLAAMSGRELMWLFSAFALAFAVKVPMFPFHTWLPDAHVEAPTAGSVILAGVLLKMGVYGFLRVCLPIFPAQVHAAAPLFIALAVVGIIYGAVVAAMQPDMKKLVAYSSVSHLGFVMLGVFSCTPLGLTGAVLQSINHGVSTGMLFFLVGMLYDRRHTREISMFGGLKRIVPWLSAVFLVALLSSAALPLTNGFVGEFTILLGAYQSPLAGPAATAVSAFGMVLSAVYLLWMFQRVFVGPVTIDENRQLPDLDARERWVLLPLVVMVFWFGCYVAPWSRLLAPWVGRDGACAAALVKPQGALSGGER